MLSSIFAMVEKIMAAEGSGEPAQSIVSVVFDSILAVLG